MSKKRKIAASPNAPVLEVRRMPNPSFGQELLEAIDTGEVSIPRHLAVPVNLSLLIGGLARIRKTKRQAEAAAQYRRAWEGGLIGAARAIDYAVPRVDTSMQSVAVLLEHGAGDRSDYSRAVRRIGMLNARLVELVVCEGRSLREVAVLLGYGDSRAKREALQRRLLAALDMLADEFAVGGPRHGRLRHEGERPCDTSVDVVIERRQAS